MYVYFLYPKTGKEGSGTRKYKRIRYEDRVKMEQLLKEGKKVTEVADILGVSRSAIHFEFRRSGTDRTSYTADIGQKSLR